MPIHNLGYREWQGELDASSTRWMVVAEVGIRRAWQSAWLRRMMFFAWVPAVAMGAPARPSQRSTRNGTDSYVYQ